MTKYPALLLSILPFLAGAAEDPLAAFRQVTPTNFDEGGEVSLQFHLHAESYLRSTTIARGDETFKLDLAPRAELEKQPVVVNGERSTFAAYVAKDSLLDSVLVLHRGQIVFESYTRMAPKERHFGWSVTKVLTSAALATLVAEGRVSMDAAIEEYLPELAGTAWAGTSVYDIANMASGIDCRDSDGYQDTSTCVYRMEESLGITAPTGSDESFVDLVKAMGRLRPAGERNEYVSANTNVLMMVIERVTQKSYADAVEERIWQRIGAESDALMAVSKEGHAYASGGLMARLRDLARFGTVFTDGERFPDVTRTMMADLKAGGGISRSKREQKWLALEHGDDIPARAGWQWDRVWDDGGVFKGGYLGQGLYADPDRDLVIAWYGTGLDFSAVQNDMLPVARQLAISGLFDPREEPDPLIAVIQKRNNAYETAFATQDMPALLALHTDDVVFMSSHRPRVEGLKNLKASLEGEFSLGKGRLKLVTEEVTRSGDFVAEVGRYELALGIDSDEPISDAGDYLVLWTQNAQGQWVIFRDVTTSTQPLP